MQSLGFSISQRVVGSVVSCYLILSPYSLSKYNRHTISNHGYHVYLDLVWKFYVLVSGHMMKSISLTIRLAPNKALQPTVLSPLRVASPLAESS